jgi:hypothetical protein
MPAPSLPDAVFAGVIISIDYGRVVLLREINRVGRQTRAAFGARSQ